MAKSYKLKIFYQVFFVFSFYFGTLAQNINSLNPTSGPIGTIVTINGTNLHLVNSVNLFGVSCIIVNNFDSSLQFLIMPGASSGTIVITSTSGTSIASETFTITANIPPTEQQGNKLVGSGFKSVANQSRSLAISADGNTAIVGGSADGGGMGAAWIFIRNGTTWAQQGNKLVGSDAIGNAGQGTSVAISADGNTAIVGGSMDNGGEGGIGAAWIFTRNGTTWMQQGTKLIGVGATGGANQGNAVAISADGNTALIGGYRDNTYVGATWVWIRSGSTWTQQGNKLVGTGSIGTSMQGYSVSLSADGNTALVGGISDNNNIGAVWVFSRAGTSWVQQGSKLVGSDAIGAANLGKTVAISYDGNTALVGGPKDNVNIGAAWIFTRTDTTWIQQGTKLVGTGAEGNASQGSAVSLSGDGNTAFIGGRTDNNNVGAVWVFTRMGNTWNQKGSKLVGSGAEGMSYQGGAISVSADANTAIVGGLYDNNAVGASWIFIYNGGAWIQQGSKLVGTGFIGGIDQGFSVGISADGKTAIIGGFGDNNTTGAAWIFTKKGTTWSQQGNKLIGSGLVGGVIQGYSVAISADGNTAIVGGPFIGGGIGGALVYKRQDTAWIQQGDILVGTGIGMNNSEQGWSVGLSADGNTAIVGGPFDDNATGAAWIFTRTGTTWNQQGSKLVGTGYVGSSFQGFSVSLSADGNTALIGGENDDNGKGAVWVFTRTGTTWTQQGNKLVGSGAEGYAYQGVSVSLNADGNTAIVGGPNDNNGKGAIWIFTRNGTSWTQQSSKIIVTGEVGYPQLGRSVAISADGNTALVGGPSDNSGKGAIWIFTRNGSNWNQLGSKLIGTGEIGNSSQGFSVSISSDGNTAVTGGPYDSYVTGAAWIWNNYSTLPIVFDQISVIEKGEDNQVIWRTIGDAQIEKFEIEYHNGAGLFETIGTVKAKSSLDAQYQWLHHNPQGQTQFYRIKAFEISGEIKYSPIVVVRKEYRSGRMILFPNPASLNFINISIQDMPEGDYEVSVFNLQGSKLTELVLNHKGGSQTRVLKFPTYLLSGYYMVHILSRRKLLFKQKLFLMSY